MTERRQVGEMRVGRQRGLAVVAVEPPSVLVGDAAPTPVGERHVGDDAEGVEGIDAAVGDRAQMCVQSSPRSKV